MSQKIKCPNCGKYVFTLTKGKCYHCKYRYYKPTFNPVITYAERKEKALKDWGYNEYSKDYKY